MSNKILICGPSWVGDMVMSHSLVQLLRQRFPASDIDMLAPSWSRAVARFMPEIQTVFTLPFGHGELEVAKRWKFANHLTNMNYERCYLLPNSFKSALIPWFARIPERVGWRAEGRSLLLTDARVMDTQKLKRMHQRYAALAFDNEGYSQEKIPLPRLQYDPSETRSLGNKFQLLDKKSMIAFAPGAEYGPSKQWPAASFAQLAQQLIAEGDHIVLIGSAQDQELCQAIKQQINPTSSVTNLAGQTRIDQVIHFLPACDALVCHDSGLMHIAAALQLPLVAIYGSTSPEHTPPLSRNAQIVHKDLDCSPCFKRECPLEHHRCMKDISPQEIFKAIAVATFEAKNTNINTTG